MVTTYFVLSESNILEQDGYSRSMRMSNRSCGEELELHLFHHTLNIELYPHL